MTPVTLRRNDGHDHTLDQDAMEDLESAFNGQIISPSDSAYDEARSVWNAMIDRRPGLIVRCRESGDVAEAVRFARKHDVLLAVRGAGHNIAGSGVCDGGMVIDLSEWRSIEVNVAERTARIQPGATLGDIDGATQPFGLALPVGINSTTGIAGLTLGGGFGWLSRKHGLTADNLISIQMVTAEGEEVTASEVENPDLFWAARGGGGNFGIATSFEFRLHALGPEVTSGLIVHPFEAAGDLLRQYREVVADAPDELCAWAVLRKAPPLPFLPEDWHGKEVLVFAACYAGDMAAGEEAMKPLRALGDPIADVIGPHPFAGWQQAFDPLLTPGARNYWKSHDLTNLSDGAIDALVEYAGKLPSDETEIFLAHLGGAINRVDVDATAYPHRDVEFVINVHARWQAAEDDTKCVEWAREFFNASAPFATGGVYVNFMPEDETDRVGSAYGANYERLAELKRRFDPDNLFRTNQNIRPA